MNYNDRLSAYILSESARLGTLSKLTRAFVHIAGANEVPMSRSTLDAWAKKSISGEINPASLAQLARYRGESPADTIAWLHGHDRQGGAGMTIERQIEVMDLAEIAIVMERLAARVKAIVRGGKLGVDSKE